MGALNLRPGHVYFLALEDAPGEGGASYYKIGITEGQVRDRIDQLQTGNPFRICECHSFWSEAAHLIERHLHRRWSTNGVRLEWFRFSSEELERSISQGELLSSQISPIATRVREYDQQPSNDCILDPTDRVRELHPQALELLSDIVQNRGKLQLAEYGLRSLTGDSLGVLGITRAQVIDPRPSFKQALLKERFSDVYEQFLTRDGFNCSFRFEAAPRITAFPDLRARMKDARATAPNLSPVDIRDEIRERDASAVELHNECLELRSELSSKEGEILLIELELRDLCGENEGFARVCSYKRTITRLLDVKALRQARPEVYSACLEKTPAHVRFSVVESRSYA